MKHGITSQLGNPENYFEEVAEIVRLTGFLIFRNFLNANEVEESRKK